MMKNDIQLHGENKNTISNRKMQIFVVFKCFDESDGYLCFDMKGCFSTVDKAKEYITNLIENDTSARSSGEPCHPEMSRENNWTLVRSRKEISRTLDFAPYLCKGFCIETVDIDPPFYTDSVTQQDAEIKNLTLKVKELDQELRSKVELLEQTLSVLKGTLQRNVVHI